MPRLSDGTPYIAVGANELKERLAAEIKCPVCGCMHPVEQSGPSKYYDSETGEWKVGPAGLLQFYCCGEKTYLAGIEGKAWR